MPEKNEIYESEITGISSLGYGVCRISGLVCFVSGGVTGDKLKVKIIKVNKDFCVGRIEEIIVPSPYRKEQDCPFNKKCGGCSFRHIDYEYEKKLKKELVESELKKNRLSIKVNDTVSAGKTERYRNKAQYPVSFDGRIGFYSQRSHEICEVGDCLLQPEIFKGIVKDISDFIKEYKIPGYDEESGKGILRHVYLRSANKTGEIFLALVINSDTFPKSDKLIEKLKKYTEIKSIFLNVNKKKTNAILGDRFECIYGKDYITDELCNLKFNISPASFYQVNRDCAELLYNKVCELVMQGKHETVTDLYCGTGTIGLCVAKKVGGCRLYGVEIVKEAIENAKQNAKQNGIENAEFVCTDSKNAKDIYLKASDVVILDPPRKGIDKSLAEKLAECDVKSIVYVSCSPNTLARDLKTFEELGYTFDELTPFDMFPRTTHIESVVLIRKNTK